MAFDLEGYIMSRPVEVRERLREQMKHSESCYHLNGEHIELPNDRENLLAVIQRMKRYMLDTNFLWNDEAGKPENFDKAFILGQTVTDEVRDVRKLFFGPRVNVCNNNLFEFGMEEFRGVFYLKLSRLDSNLRSIFDEKKLETESLSTVASPQRLSNVQLMRQSILEILELKHIKHAPKAGVMEHKRASLMQAIRANAPHCFLNYWNAVDVATNCYALLLLERDGIGDKTRHEFNKPNNPNIFGDTRLVQNALWHMSHILSRDKAVKRMGEYIDLPAITVSEKLENPYLRILWFRLLKLIRVR
ncbi:MAG: hypothetical protein JWQ71_992 [Pedosphaera sp.]|nr:hypothetical protein [Pedosphaera sp.]